MNLTKKNTHQVDTLDLSLRDIKFPFQEKAFGDLCNHNLFSIKLLPDRKLVICKGKIAHELN